MLESTSLRRAPIYGTVGMNLSEFECHVVGFYRSLQKSLLGVDEMERVAGV
jgi:hypothetical protein